jgi:hypothetical protein
MICFDQRSLAYRAPSLLVNLGYIGPGLLLGLIRSTRN